MFRVLSLVVLAGCASEEVTVPSGRHALDASWVDFPSERDLAILLPLEREPLFPADTMLDADTALLPEAWLDSVSRAYLDTAVGDALESESLPEDWRLVSMRVSPCAPIARSPAQAPASLCWPIVRLVWQPVVGHMNLAGIQLDAYADDRAIHALYPVAPRDEQGARIEGAAYQQVQALLGEGQSMSSIPDGLLAAYDEVRDDTTIWLLSRLEQLRGDGLPIGSWDGLSTRPELELGPQSADRFRADLHAFLRDFAPPSDIREMTSFSLPAGRNPSGDDSWVFLQFLSDGTGLRRGTLEVYSRTDAGLLLDYGDSQEVGMVQDSDAVMAALDADPNGELHDTVVESTADIDQIADLIRDPEQVFVPNTTCGTCHRLNDIRFDFHSLSHLEDRDHTISPRVVEDVARDRSWTAAWLESAQPMAPITTETDDADSSSSDTGDPDTALPFMVDGEITSSSDIDTYTVTTGGPLRVTLTFSHGRGDLDLYLYDAAGALLAWSETTLDEERIDVSVSQGSYTIEVRGYQGATGPYTLYAE